MMNERNFLNDTFLARIKINGEVKYPSGNEFISHKLYDIFCTDKRTGSPCFVFVYQFLHESEIYTMHKCCFCRIKQHHTDFHTETYFSQIFTQK